MKYASDFRSIARDALRGKWAIALQFSFIGWSILCSLTMGIGNLWLTPYKQAATAAFYREVSGTKAQEVYQNMQPEV